MTVGLNERTFVGHRDFDLAVVGSFPFCSPFTLLPRRVASRKSSREASGNIGTSLAPAPLYVVDSTIPRHYTIIRTSMTM